MPVEATLDRLHANVTNVRWLQYFTVFTRLLLALGFLPSGLMKVFGIPFGAGLGIEHPIGYFFDALHRAGLWYHFIGWMQVTAALLLLFPRTALLGAIIYFPLILNILFITYSLDFQGTRQVTTLMLLASIYLLFWDYERLKALLPRRCEQVGAFAGRVYYFCAIVCGTVSVAIYGIAAALGIANVDKDLGWSGAIIAVVCGISFGLFFGWHLRNLPVSTSRENYNSDG